MCFLSINKKREKVCGAVKNGAGIGELRVAPTSLPTVLSEQQLQSAGQRQSSGKTTQRIELRWNHSHSITWVSPEGQGDLHPGV